MDNANLIKDIDFFLQKRKYDVPKSYKEIEERLLETLNQDMKNYTKLNAEIKDFIDKMSLEMYRKGVREGANMILRLLSL